MTSIRFAALLIVCGAAKAATIEGAANPIRRVVTMMQNMQKKIAAEGERDAELFDKFMCYCKTGTQSLEASIKAAETKIPQVDSALEEARALKTQLGAELKQHREDREEALAAVAKAKAIRKKEADAFAKTDADYKANIAALGKAIAAISKGMSGFLQTSSASVLRRLTVEMDMSSVDRDVLSSFLSQGEGQQYAPQAGQINGILKQMKDTMEADLAEATEAEQKSIAAFSELTAAKEKEISANTKAIESKVKREGEVGVQVVNLEEDLDDTQKSLADDKKFLADLSKNCATAEADYEVVKKTRAEEQLALADTIKILNDDDALDLFKKTLPTPSLLQTQVTFAETKRQALSKLVAVKGRKDFRLDLISMALRGKKVSFDKVIGMIDDMVKLLGEEQTADDQKKAYCETEIDKAEDELKGINQRISDLEKSIEESEGTLKSTIAEIGTLGQSIKDLDKSVAEATENRKAENAEYKDTMASDSAAKELLGIAKNRLNKFYNPKLYVAAAKRELSRAQRIAYNNGEELAATAAPGGIAGTGVTAFVQLRSDDLVAPPPPPEAVGAYQKKGQESNAVITMIDMLIADLDKEIQEMTVEEKDSQAEYETFVKDSAAKRADDSQSLADKEDAKAELEVNLQKQRQDKKSSTVQAMGKDKFLSDLHMECDWLVQNFGTRKEARAGEIESLKNAKAVLSGAGYSLVQMSHVQPM